MSRNRSLTDSGLKQSKGPRIVKKIGSGLTAKVYEVIHPIYGKTSLKAIEPNFYKSAVGNNLIKNQIEILKCLSHENVIKMQEYSLKEGSIMILTNYCEGGDLENKIKQAKYLSVGYSLKVFSGILNALTYIFSKNIIHRDIKPANIFLTADKLVLADFGFAIKDNNPKMRQLNVGSPLYMAPESLSSKQFSQKSDIFGMGVVLFEMLSGKTPWSALSEKDLLYKMKNSPPSPPLTCSKQLQSIIYKCLSVDQDDRPTIQELKTMITQVRNKQFPQTVKKEVQVKQKKIQLTEKKPYKLELTQRKQNKAQKVEVRQNKAITHYFKPIRLNPMQKENKSDKKQNLSIKSFHSYSKRESSGKSTNFTLLASRTKKKSAQLNNLKIVQEEKNSDKFQTTLMKVKPQIFTFLPVSLIAKLRFILEKYINILAGDVNPVILSEEEQKDVQIREVNQCGSQGELCRVIEGFIRRLYRLTKNYKGYQKELEDLKKLYDRVTIMVV